MDARVANILAYPQTAQRTPAWYVERAHMLTASDVARAIGLMGDRERERLVQEKARVIRTGVVAGDSGRTNPVLQFGVDNEDAARDAVEEYLKTKVYEVGLIRHPVHTWLGASVDGLTADGCVVELKCPYSRKIVHGQIPIQYFCQVQVQMECLDLDTAWYAEVRHIKPSPREMNIMRMERDRAWFEKTLPAMQLFMDDVHRAAARDADDSGHVADTRASKAATLRNGMYD